MSQTADIRLSDFDLDRDTVHRWRKRLADPRRFDAALEAGKLDRHLPGSVDGRERVLLYQRW